MSTPQGPGNQPGEWSDPSRSSSPSEPDESAPDAGATTVYRPQDMGGSSAPPGGGPPAPQTPPQGQSYGPPPTTAEPSYGSYGQPGYGQSGPGYSGQPGQQYSQPGGYGQPSGYPPPSDYQQPGSAGSGYGQQGYPAAPPGQGSSSYPQGQQSYAQPDYSGYSQAGSYAAPSYAQSSAYPQQGGYGQSAYPPPGGSGSSSYSGFGSTTETAPKKSNQALIIGVVAVLVVAAIAAVVLFVWPGLLNKKVFDERQVTEGVTNVLTGTPPTGYGLSGVTDVSCPSGQEVKANTSFQCTLKVDGTDRTVTVTVRGDDDTAASGGPASGVYEVSPPS